VNLDFDGYSIGGLSVGEGKDEMYEFTDLSTDYLPEDKARYLMGVGSPEDLVQCVSLGIDMFDCVLPTRIARNGSVFTRNGRMNLINAKHKFSDEPIERDCGCFSCRNFSRGYLRHMFKTNEMLASRLTTTHNLTFLYNLMKEIRQAIEEENFSRYKKDFLASYLRKV
jgi:queuine tRNA-ribosyltransferase